MGEEGSFDRSIDGCIRPSVTRLCRSRLVAREPRRVRNIGRAGGAPRAPPCTQLSHLPIGPSHVLICLLVNPPFPSLIVYFVLSYFLSLFSRLSWNPCAHFFPPLAFPLRCFFPFPSSFEGSHPVSLCSALPLPFPSARAKSHSRSHQNGFDRSTIDANYFSYARIKESRILVRKMLFVHCYTICALSI